MSSKYSQNRQLNGSGDLNRATASHRMTPILRESMLAYDSHHQQGATPKTPTIHQRVDRTYAPGTESDRKGVGGLQRDENSSPGRWFGRPSKSSKPSKPISYSQGKGKSSLDKSLISSPMNAAATAPRRPPRPSIEQTPALFYGLPELEELRSPPTPQPSRNSSQKPLPQTPQPQMYYPRQQRQPIVTKPPTIRPEHLGLRHEALGSHPITTLRSGMAEKTPAARIMVSSATKKHNRRATIYPGSDESHIMLKEPQIHDDLREDRRRGRVYASAELHEFPDPSSWQGSDEIHEQGYFTDELNDDDDYDSDRTWDDDSEPEIRDPNVPTINIVAPEDEPPQEVRPKKTHLHPGDAWESLYEQKKEEVRSLENCLLPLAWMVAEATNMDLDDYKGIHAALAAIINDRERMRNLWPLAVTLAKDQGLNAHDLNALKPALRGVFAERDQAKDTATIHKRARHALERRVRELESEMASMSMSMRATEYDDDGDDEEYIR